MLSGAAAGIGYSTALRLANEGANLIVIDYDANGIKALKKKLNSSIFETYVHDIADEEGTKKITTETIRLPELFKFITHQKIIIF